MEIAHRSIRAHSRRNFSSDPSRSTSFLTKYFQTITSPLYRCPWLKKKKLGTLMNATLWRNQSTICRGLWWSCSGRAAEHTFDYDSTWAAYVMTLIALSGYAATACIPTVFYYSFAVKKRALLVVTALARYPWRNSSSSASSFLIRGFVQLHIRNGFLAHNFRYC